MPERLAKYLWAALCWALVIAALWLALRFLLPWLAPFLVALGAAALMEPAVGALARHGWNADAIVRIDSTTGTVWLTGQGREPGEQPYQTHLYRVNGNG